MTLFAKWGLVIAFAPGAVAPDTGITNRVLRGGSGGASVYELRSAHRGTRVPWGRSNFIGFRVVRLP